MSRPLYLPPDQLPDKLKPATGEQAAKRSRRSSNAVKSGRNLQDELEATHAAMANRGWGCVYPHARETFGVPGKLMYKRGGNPIDYTGFVNLMRYGTGRADSGGQWRSGSVVNPADTRWMRFCIPVAFDAKREGDGALYHHKPRDIHQIMQLEEAAKNGAAAFLLVHAVAVGRIYVIGPSFFPLLRMHQPVRLYETAMVTTTGQPRPQTVHTRDCHPAATYQLGLGWPYAPLIPLACPGAIR